MSFYFVRVLVEFPDLFLPFPVWFSWPAPMFHSVESTCRLDYSMPHDLNPTRAPNDPVSVSCLPHFFCTALFAPNIPPCRLCWSCIVLLYSFVAKWFAIHWKARVTTATRRTLKQDVGIPDNTNDMFPYSCFLTCEYYIDGIRLYCLVIQRGGNATAHQSCHCRPFHKPSCSRFA